MFFNFPRKDPNGFGAVISAKTPRVLAPRRILQHHPIPIRVLKR